MSNGLKILRIAGFEKPGGGGQKHVLKLHLGLRERGHRDLLLCPLGSLAEEYRKSGGEVLSLCNGMKGPSSLREIMGVIKKEQPDIVHTHMPWADGVGGMAAKLQRVPLLLTTIHGYYYTSDKGKPKKPFKRWLYGRWLTMTPQKVVAVSQALKDWLMKDFGVPEGKIATLHVGTEIKELPPDFDPQKKRRELGLREEDFPVAVVARLEPAKGQTTVIEALPPVLRKHPGVRVLFLGEGSQRADVERKTREQGVAEQVRFMGFRRDVPEILASCRAFILPSLKEGISNALLEALYRGLPVIVSRSGGNPEVVEEGITGLLFPYENAPTLAEAWIKIIEQPAWAQELGQRGRELVEQNYSMDKGIMVMENIYRELEERQGGF